MWEALGLSADEERVHELVLARPGLTTAELAAVARRDRAATEEVLRSLDARSLVTRDPRRPDRWVPVPPEAAVEACLGPLQEGLARARALLPGLIASYSRGREGPAPVQLIRGLPAIADCWAHLQRCARYEVWQFDKPPYVGTPANQAARATPSGGVVYRTVHEESGVCDETMPELANRSRRGELIRVLPDIPTKLALVDRQWALLPATTKGDPPDALLVRVPTLVSLLANLFEACWRQATPLVSLPDRGGADPSLRRRVLALLATGMTDRNIASQLGIGLRTTQRHVRALMDVLGARSRFQAGVLAAQLGLLEPGEAVARRRNGARLTPAQKDTQVRDVNAQVN
ncbi:hypothetical protein GCM10012275_33940 [Longimycelium tulufanense]|uniref:HTH luxR-type domain-containing protein n=1 Tax=Longimycelium tulufanense TaxID=907463 RepID=A0A8J3C9C0_9PSEU|nr:helix-turn-helix domain-containing protein [Longimycelium tulufanense]GGM60025.1 hypothetical protein GCM10012275_33940 [Longimycelium tulufanense]